MADGKTAFGMITFSIECSDTDCCIFDRAENLNVESHCAKCRYTESHHAERR
jgi:hypothetical protein